MQDLHRSEVVLEAVYLVMHNARHDRYDALPILPILPAPVHARKCITFVARQAVIPHHHFPLIPTNAKGLQLLNVINHVTVF